MRDALPALLQALAGYLDTFPDVPEACSRSLRENGHTRPAGRSAGATAPEVLQFVHATLASVSELADTTEPTTERAPAARLIHRLAAHHQALAWRRPGFDTLPQSLAARLAVSEVCGPDGMIGNAVCRVGFLLQAADTLYPWHQHAAEEWYAILAGDAVWGFDNDVSASKSADTLIHHPSWVMHSIQTHAKALLAVWVWSGDIAGSHYRLATTG